jgi:hypothetical protein
MEILKPITDGWIKKTNAANLPGTEIFELVRSLDEKYSQEYGGFGR